MPWYGWLILAAGIVLLLAALCFRLVRASRRGRRFMSLSTRGKVDFGRVLLADREVPLTAKASLVILVAYLALPFDLIPDFIPVLGQADDFLVVLAAVGLLLVAVPRERFEEALARAERAQDARRSAGARRADALPRRREG